MLGGTVFPADDSRVFAGMRLSWLTKLATKTLLFFGVEIFNELIHCLLVVKSAIFAFFAISPSSSRRLDAILIGQLINIVVELL